VGMLSDSFLRKFSRTAWLCVVAALMALTQALYFAANIPMIFGIIAIHGLAYGGNYAVIPTLTSEFFGLKHFGANYGLIAMAPALGSQLISTILAGYLYDHFEQDSYVTVGGEKHCLGRQCYRYTLLSTLCICLLAIATSFVIKGRYWRRTEKFNQLQDAFPLKHHSHVKL